MRVPGAVHPRADRPEGAARVERELRNGGPVRGLAAYLEEAALLDDQPIRLGELPVHDRGMRHRLLVCRAGVMYAWDPLTDGLFRPSGPIDRDRPGGQQATGQGQEAGN